MSIKALNKNLHVPVAVHSQTAKPVTVLHLINSSPSHIPPDELPHEAQIEFVINAWEKGLWDGDIIIDQGKPLGMTDAIAEIRSDSENGKILLKTALRALEMLRELVATTLEINK